MSTDWKQRPWPIFPDRSTSL